MFAFSHADLSNSPPHVERDVFTHLIGDSSPHRPRIFTRLTHWVAELVLVFVGAYAAFWLTTYQGKQGEAKRHQQILAELEQHVSQEIEDANAEVTRHRNVTAEFERPLAAGEMPPLQPFNFASGYNAGDVAALLQAGAFELL